MKKILYMAAIFGVIITLAGCAKNNANTNAVADVKEPIFFYSTSCSHCQKVKQYIADNKIEEKMTFSSLEAFTTEENYNLFNTKATVCGIPEKQRGVPMVYEGGKCYVGEIEAIDFFKKKAGL